jgi:carbon storage regulator CsrA
MLVLARRPDETIVFPNVGVTLRIVRVKGQVVRVAIDAPDDVRILRGEIATEPGDSRPGPRGLSAEWVHALRNRLNSAFLSGELLKALLESGNSEDVQGRLTDLLTELQSLDELLEFDEASNEPVAEEAPFRVLVVEDQENERTLLANVLEMKGAQVAAVGDGCEALEYLRTHERPDFILLDMSMPRCSGPELLESLRREKIFHDLKVFAVSGQTEQSSGVPVGPNGVDGWFRKPLNTKRLIASMHTAAGA